MICGDAVHLFDVIEALVDGVYVLLAQKHCG